MNGTEYVIEQLGDALRNSHAALAEQAARIAKLEDLLLAVSPVIEHLDASKDQAWQVAQEALALGREAIGLRTAR